MALLTHSFHHSIIHRSKTKDNCCEHHVVIGAAGSGRCTLGLIGCPHIGQPGSRYAAVVCLVVGCIHVTRRVLLCRLFGLPHMHQRLCLAMQKRSSGQALEMRPKSAHLWSQAHAMHSQAAADLARSAMLPRYRNQSGPQ